MGVGNWLARALGIVREEPLEEPEPSQHRSKVPSFGVAGSVEIPYIGELLGARYRLDQLIGHGGVAVVYRGYDLKLYHHVAIKVLLFDRVNSTPEFGRHLRDEARVAMRLSHPFITRVFNYGRQGGWEYLVMEFVRGQNLNVLSLGRPNGRLELREAIHIGLDTLDALAYAHKQGVIHNDITPKNILINQKNEVKLCDFGLSRLTDLQVRRSFKTILGTAAYISPERLQGRPADVRSDLYSLGATLFKISTGRPHAKFRTDNAGAEPALGEDDAFPDLPRSFKLVLDRALMKDPNARFTDAAEMSEALLEVLRNRVSVPVSNVDRRFKNTFELETAPGEQKVPSLQNNNKTSPEMVWIDPVTIEYEGIRFSIDSFYMDRTPVTNRQYAEYIATQAQLPPVWWNGVHPPEDKLDHPVVGITIAQARRYAAWCNKRLPTTLEWVAALYEIDRRESSHETPPKAKDNFAQITPHGTSKVGEYSSGAWAGACTDLLGNVWEWTEVDERFPPPDQAYYYVMGGSYQHPPEADDVVPRTTVSKFGEYLYLGFRCARDKDRLNDE
jgi:serine/threonine protein kinase